MGRNITIAKNAANRLFLAVIGLASLAISSYAPLMLNRIAPLLLTIVMFWPSTPSAQNSSIYASGPEYTSANEMNVPQQYREWIYLSTGFDMSYNPAMRMGHDMFDNVFVNPEAYKAFLNTGTWPDKTMLVLEVRGAQSKGSINQAGSYQGTDLMGLEIHIKDEAKFPGKWAFFGADGGKTAKLIPQTAECYSCHAAHAAVDTTFVQFYPTLLPIAKSKGTLSSGYEKEADGTPASKH